MSNNFSQVGIIQNQVPHLEDIGFPVAMAATALGGVGLMSAIGKFVFGWLCDRIQAKYSCLIGLGIQVIAIIVFINIRSESPISIIWLYAILMGFGVGSWLPTMSMLTSTSFGVAHYGAIFGVVAFAQSIGASTGPLVAGFLFDTMNSYHLAFIISLAIYAISVPTILAVRRPKAFQNAGLRK
jgi:MFS family permease